MNISKQFMQAYFHLKFSRVCQWKKIENLLKNDKVIYMSWCTTSCNSATLASVVTVSYWLRSVGFGSVLS